MLKYTIYYQKSTIYDTIYKCKKLPKNHLTRKSVEILYASFSFLTIYEVIKIIRKNSPEIIHQKSTQNFNIIVR